MKKRYRVSGLMTISVTTVVWAENEDEAQGLAQALGNYIGIIDRGCDELEWVTADQLDGTVQVVGVEACPK